MRFGVDDGQLAEVLVQRHQHAPPRVRPPRPDLPPHRPSSERHGPPQQGSCCLGLHLHPHMPADFGEHFHQPINRAFFDPPV